MFRRIALLLPVATALSGCYVETHHDDYAYSPSPPAEVVEATIDPGAEVVEVAIDPGEALYAQPGEGAGVFIEYPGAGRWRLLTACDTNLSGYECAWDVFVTSDSRIDDVDGEGLEPDDDLYRYRLDSRSLGFQVYTSLGFDGFQFSTGPGDTVRIETYLDGNPDPRFIFWVGDGGLHRGAPSNPIDLTPGPE